MKTRVPVAAGLVLGLLPCAAAHAQTPPPARVLVMPFAAEAAPDSPGGAGTALWLGEAASVLLSDGLRQRRVAALDRDDRERVFDRLQVPMSSALTAATMIRIGELGGATAVLVGDVRLGQALTVRARVIELSDARSGAELVDEAPLADIFRLFDRLADRIAGAVGGAGAGAGPRPGAAGAPGAAGSGSAVDRPGLEWLEAYVKGLVAPTPAAQQRFLEVAMTLAPHDGRALTALWRVYSEQDQHDKALAVASAVPAESPLRRRARFNVALSLIELRRFDGAARELAALHRDEPSAAVSNALGVAELRRAPADFSLAASFFERAARESAHAPDYVFNAGYARALAADAEPAIAWLREAVRLDAADGDAHVVMSALLHAAGRSAEALRELELARLLGTTLDVVPAAPVATVPLGLERLRADLDAAPIPGGAAGLVSPGRQDQADVAAFHLGRARRFLETSRDREALPELRRAIYLAPYEEEPHFLLGALHQRSGRLAEAIDEFKVAIWCRETVRARVALGAALLQAGDVAGARREAERALALDPQSEAARALVKRIGVLPSPGPHE
jgi:tetratricopeptide (TPR) repeat protein